ncbi:NU6M oxidoreductase, partial [Onychorhynchus coronatus]|nr:NU6M oxidoreductase [Onychorhynchus coronatus]
MTYFVLFLGLCFVLGELAVATLTLHPLMEWCVCSFAGGGWLLSLEVSFVSLVLFMVYSGGMTVRFVYFLSLVADPF